MTKIYRTCRLKREGDEITAKVFLETWAYFRTKNMTDDTRTARYPSGAV